MSFEYINTRCKKILYMIIAESNYTSIDEIAKEIGLSKRSIYYEICKVNEWLESQGLPELEITRGKGIHLEPEIKNQIESVMDSGKEIESYIFSPTERVRVMICYMIHSEKPIFIEQLTEYCKVSRNTVFNDLRAVVSQLQDYDLCLEYETKTGYKITGDNIRIRALFFLYFNMLQPLFNSGILRFINKKEMEEYLEKLKLIEKKLGTDYVEGILLSLAALMPLMHRNDQQLYFPGLKSEEMIRTKEYRLIEEYFGELEEKEKIYLCLHLLGSRVTLASDDFFEEHANQSVYEISKALVAEFEKVACVIFEDKETLERALFVHINASMYRYQYGIQVGNPMRDDIVREYSNLFDLTKIACNYLEQQIGLPISDSEIAYLALHFGAHLRTGQNKEENLRVLIVCVNGISTGNMLKREISRLLPRIRIVDVVAASDIVNIQDICDIVISTVKINSLVPMIVVHPILTDLDRKNILGHPMIKAGMGLVDVEGIFQSIKKYIPEKHYNNVKKELSNYIKKEGAIADHSWIRQANGMCDLLDDDTILVTDRKMKWEEALRYAAIVLEQRGSINTSYIEKIISQIRYYGPYMFITPNVILAHAKPEDGVFHLDLSMCILKEPVRFSEFHQAEIIMVLAAEDQEKHLKILKDIMTVFAETERVDELRKRSNVDEIKKYLEKVLEKTGK